MNWLDPENPQAGGAEVHLFAILRRLAERGHEVTVMCSGWPGCAAQACYHGVTVRRVGGRHSFALLGPGAVRRAVGARAYDVVIEDINKLPLYLPVLTALPVYVIVPHLFGATVFREAAWPIAAVVWLAERPIPWAYRRCAFHAISDSTRDDLVRRGIAAEQVRVIYPGVDAEWYAPAGDPEAARARAPTFLYVGRLKRYKGIETAIRAVARLHESGTLVRLVVAGDGDDRARLEEVARRLGVRHLVEFRGFVSDDEKRALMRQAWAVVLPSAKEGWGLTNVEAAACGTPALAADRPGLRETVRHGETGFLFPYGDAPALARQLASLASDPGLVSRMGVAARRFAARLGWDVTAEQTETHLREVLARARRGRKE